MQRWLRQASLCQFWCYRITMSDARMTKYDLCQRKSGSCRQESATTLVQKPTDKRYPSMLASIEANEQGIQIG